MVETVVFFENGNYAAFRDGEQDPPEQGNAWLDVLQAKLDRKAIDPKTRVKMPGWWTPDHENGIWTVEELVKIGRLKVAK